MGTRMLRRGLPRVAGGEAWPPPTEVEVPDEPAAKAAAGAAASAPSRRLRRGLPRVAGGDSWPPSADIEAAAPTEASVAATEEATVSRAATDGSVGPSAATDAAAPAPPAAGAPLRRGLPRESGGAPWPAAGVAPAAAPSADPGSSPRDESATASSAHDAAGPVGERVALRRGLPRVVGGDPWPPAGLTGFVAGPPVEVADQSPVAAEPDTTVSDEALAPAVPERAPEPTSAPQPAPAAGVPAAKKHPTPEARRYGPFTMRQWVGAGIVGLVALGAIAAGVVVLVRWLLEGPLAGFVQAYPGEYHLPEGAPLGFPGWLGWQHFFNVFLMVLIIRSGLQVRHEKRPSAFWTPKNNRGGKVSLTIWFHQSLDILWLVNGVVFVVLLFVTGQWMRVIPTSWEVFPNALSAVLQYVSLDWPTENGWVNYNSIQQLAYFATIFLAAPLAAATGFRMSGMWPKKAEKLSRVYPIEWARAVHFPVMLYFVVFIAIHVFLVLATGALRNLNHMYAVQGSTDPAAFAGNWTGLGFFVASLVVIAAAWVAARPMILAPIARLFGTVSSR